MKRNLAIVTLLVFATISFLLALVLAPFEFIVSFYRFKLGELVGRMPPAVRKVLKMRDSNGLMYDIETLGKIRNEVVFWPIEEQAYLADLACINLVKGPHSEARFREFADFDFREFGQLNATAIGNAAYIASHSPYPDVRRDAKIYLEAIREYFEAFK